MANTASNFELLRAKPILAILDGDTKFGELQLSPTKTINNALPYLTGPMLCEISNKFGLPVNYSRNGGVQSRWVYLDDLLAHCIRNNRASDLLSFLFSKEQFVHTFRGCTVTEIEPTYQTIITTVIDKIIRHWDLTVNLLGDFTFPLKQFVADLCNLYRNTQIMIAFHNTMQNLELSRNSRQLVERMSG